jgi:hypothetical protein
MMLHNSRQKKRSKKDGKPRISNKSPEGRSMEERKKSKTGMNGMDGMDGINKKSARIRSQVLQRNALG